MSQCESLKERVYVVCFGRLVLVVCPHEQPDGSGTRLSPEKSDHTRLQKLHSCASVDACMQYMWLDYVKVTIRMFANGLEFTSFSRLPDMRFFDGNRSGALSRFI